MLGYLLNPREDHGLGDTFLRHFLEIVQNGTSNQRLFSDVLARAFVDAQVSLEEPYSLGGARKDIDAQVVLSDAAGETEQHRIIIENKIKTGSANYEQLRDYFQAVMTDDDFASSRSTLTVVFLTPPLTNKGLQHEYAELTDETLGRHHKAWLHWTPGSDGDRDILTLLRGILAKEQNAEIRPINEYLRQTVKAFVCHLNSTVGASRVGKGRSVEPVGDIVDQVEVTISRGSFRIQRRTSNQIEIYNLESDEKEVAKPILKLVNEEHGLSIPLEFQSGAALNTQHLGKKIIDALNDRRRQQEP